MRTPQIDQRTYPQLVADTEQLVRQFSGWQPRIDGQPDAGDALIRIFSRFAELTIQRLNQVPEKNFLAFLNLIGTELLPPQPARVPLTFTLAANSPVDPVVPAGTQVAAPPLEGEEEEVVFETDQELIVSRSKIQAAYAYDSRTDRYSDLITYVNDEVDAAFPLFEGDQAVAHQLYLACDELLADVSGQTLTLDLYSPDNWQWETWPIHWEYWDGAAWRQLAGNTPTRKGAEQWQISFPRIPTLKSLEVNGREACWIRARLELPLPPGASGRIPSSILSGNNVVDFSQPFHPFGDGAATFWYLSSDEVFAQGGAIAVLDVEVANAAVAPAGLRLEWAAKTNGKWQVLREVGFRDDTGGFRQSGTIRFRIPRVWSTEDQLNRRGRWLRVKVTQEEFQTSPIIESITLGWEWELPRLRRVVMQLEPTGSVPGGAGNGSNVHYPELGFTNNLPIDVSKDFYPFGAKPEFNDTFYIACDEALGSPGARVKLEVQLTNAASGTIPVVRTAGNPIVVWEVSSGRTWQQVTDSKKVTAPNVLTLTNTGTLEFSVPANVAPSVVNGEEKHWLRARLIGGNFGEAAKYEGNAKDGYTLTPATYAAPVVKSATFSVTLPAGNEESSTTQTTRPVSACLAYNDLEFVDHTTVAAADDAALFTPFTVISDTQPALYLGLDRPFDERPITLYVQVEPPRPEEVAADRLSAPMPRVAANVSWEFFGAGGWRSVGALDETATLTRRGLVHLIGPRGFLKSQRAGQSMYWLRLRWHGGEFVYPPRLRRVLLNTVWATQATTSRNEILGSSNGNPNQRFFTSQSPVLPGQQLEVRERETSQAEALAPLANSARPAIPTVSDEAGQVDEVWVPWEAQPDLYASRPRDRHYTIDQLSGEIRFGDGQQGMIPPLGQGNIRVSSYRYGGGAQGNRAAGTIIELRSSVPYVASVTNHDPANGGAAQESLGRVKQRGPAKLRHRNRAVTAQDLEDLAYEATPDVARVRAILPNFEPFGLWLDPNSEKDANRAQHVQVRAGGCGLVIVPRGSEPRPTPSLSLIERLRDYLLNRTSATADLWVAGPEWIEVSVVAEVVPSSLRMADAVVGSVRAALDSFLHPLTGGPDGSGWSFGAIPRRSDFYALLEAISGIDYVRNLTVTRTPITSRDDADELREWLQRTRRSTTALTDEQQQLQDWVNRSLVSPGTHDIRVVFETS